MKKTIAILLALGICLAVFMAASGCKKEEPAAAADAEHPTVDKVAEEHPAAEAADEAAKEKPKDHPAH